MDFLNAFVALANFALILAIASCGYALLLGGNAKAGSGIEILAAQKCARVSWEVEIERY